MATQAQILANHRKTRKTTRRPRRSSLSQRSWIAKPGSEAGQPINQNNLIMQNKAKFPDEQTNVSDALTAGYKNMCLPCHPQNKPDTNPIQSQPKPIQTQSKPNQTQSCPP